MVGLHSAACDKLKKETNTNQSTNQIPCDQSRLNSRSKVTLLAGYQSNTYGCGLLNPLQLTLLLEMSVP